MNRLLFAAALSTLAIAACSQKQEAAPPPAPAPAAAAPAPEAPVASVAPGSETPAVVTVDTTKPAETPMAAVPGEPKLQPK